MAGLRKDLWAGPSPSSWTTAVLHLPSSPGRETRRGYRVTPSGPGGACLSDWWPPSGADEAAYISRANPPRKPTRIPDPSPNPNRCGGFLFSKQSLRMARRRPVQQWLLSLLVVRGGCWRTLRCAPGNRCDRSMDWFVWGGRQAIFVSGPLPSCLHRDRMSCAGACPGCSCSPRTLFGRSRMQRRHRST
jgi:hypothetical protein